MTTTKIIFVKETPITITQVNGHDYISLTDIARTKNPEEPKDVIKNWMRSKTTIEFLGLWEQLFNPDFKGVDFDPFLSQAGSNSFTLSPSRWIEKTNAIGIVSKSGANGGSFAHSDIALEFASWISSGFKLYLIKEFQRFKELENTNKNLEWNLQRTLSKINYRIHTDAIKDTLIPPALTKEQSSIIYASEADVLNMALFGRTAADWRKENRNSKRNIRDEATLEQLVILTNLESLNSVLLRQKLPQSERLRKLNEVAISQMRSLLKNKSIKKITNK